MQRYKQHLIDKYGTYEGYNLAYNRNIPYPNQRPIQADNYGHYVGYHTTYRAYHCDKLDVAASYRKGKPYVRNKACKRQWMTEARNCIISARYVRYMNIRRLP